MVFRARHRLDGNVVALKRVLGAGMARDASPRILEEARAIACLRHPNIITIFFSGEDHDVWYYTMELMKGGSLEDHIPEYFANPAKAVEMLEQVARGTHHAHSEGSPPRPQAGERPGGRRGTAPHLGFRPGQASAHPG